MEALAKLWNHVAIKAAALVAGVAVLYYGIRFLLPLVFPFLFAGVVSVVYYPFLRRLCHKTGLWRGRRKRWLLVLAVTLFYAGVLLLLSLLGSYLFGQGRSILLNFPFYQARVLYLLKNCCGQVDGLLHVEEGVCYAYMEELFGSAWGSSLTGMLPKVTTYSVQMAQRVFQCLFAIVITVITTFFMVQEYDEIREAMLRSEMGRKICRIIVKSKETLRIYLRAQGWIMLLDGTLCTVAFLIIHQPYAFVLGPVVAVVDALPVLGAGLVLLPYILFLLLSKKTVQACVLFAAYVGCILIRQITEPRMIGQKIGVKPLYTVISMYIGFRLFGIVGFLLGPMGVLIGKEVVQVSG
ncbi:MAG: AI-2E family transporter [Lachnospiraceae bacterium]|nr:AI-2E family transporter [Lachnospiraceae bacterium]